MSEHAGPLAELCGRGQAWAGDDPVHLLGLDRHGVLFRVEPRTGCYDLRTPFPAPLTTTGELPAAVRTLLTCPR
jgi:hypothetical protein